MFGFATSIIVACVELPSTSMIYGPLCLWMWIIIIFNIVLYFSIESNYTEKIIFGLQDQWVTRQKQQPLCTVYNSLQNERKEREANGNIQSAEREWITLYFVQSRSNPKINPLPFLGKQICEGSA